MIPIAKISHSLMNNFDIKVEIERRKNRKSYLRQKVAEESLKTFVKIATPKEKAKFLKMFKKHIGENGIL